MFLHETLSSRQRESATWLETLSILLWVGAYSLSDLGKHFSPASKAFLANCIQ